MDFQLETRKLSVKLLLQGGVSVSGVIFLPPSSSTHLSLTDTLTQFLREGPAFIPLRLPGNTHFIAKRSIIAMSTDRPEDDDDPTALGLCKAVPVNISLSHGKTFAGVLAVDQQEGASRTLDELNRTADFLVLRSPTELTFIGARSVVAVREVRTPQPVHTE